MRTIKPRTRSQTNRTIAKQLHTTNQTQRSNPRRPTKTPTSLQQYTSHQVPTQPPITQTIQTSNPQIRQNRTYQAIQTPRTPKQSTLYTKARRRKKRKQPTQPTSTLLSHRMRPPHKPHHQTNKPKLFRPQQTHSLLNNQKFPINNTLPPTPSHKANNQHTRLQRTNQNNNTRKLSQHRQTPHNQSLRTKLLPPHRPHKQTSPHIPSHTKATPHLRNTTTTQRLPPPRNTKTKIHQGSKSTSHQKSNTIPNQSPRRPTPIPKNTTSISPTTPEHRTTNHNGPITRQQPNTPQPQNNTRLPQPTTKTQRSQALTRTSRQAKNTKHMCPQVQAHHHRSTIRHLPPLRHKQTPSPIHHNPNHRQTQKQQNKPTRHRHSRTQTRQPHHSLSNSTTTQRQRKTTQKPFSHKHTSHTPNLPSPKPST